MVDNTTAPKGTFHARLSHTGGVYRAEYSGEVNPKNPDAREILDYHIGTEAHEVKEWVERMARGLGYSHVVWEEDVS
jgi:predicted SprT family Zn-dependent metalloprotease